MALTLPGISIDNPAVEQRLIAAFGGLPAYREWLKEAIKQEVARRESAALIKQANEVRMSVETMFDGTT